MTSVEKWEALIEHLLEHSTHKSPEGKRVVACQVILPSGPVPGMLQEAAVQGVYEILAPTMNEATKQQGSARVFFTAEHILALNIPEELVRDSRIIKPDFTSAGGNRGS